MAFNNAIEKIKRHFGVTQLSDWNDVLPVWILDLDGVGPATLDHVRIYLALKNVTLKDDHTPEFWKEKLGSARIGNAMSDDDLLVSVPFTILVDKMEQQPFGFDSIVPDVTETPADLRKRVHDGEIKQSDIKFLIPKKFKALGPANGDYSIDGYEGRIHIERKSMNDAHGTIISYGDRQRRFERELENLSTMESSAVVVECSFGRLITNTPSHGKKTIAENKRILHRRILAYTQDYSVPWYFCDNRDFAEITTFRIFKRFIRKINESNKQSRKVEVENKVDFLESPELVTIDDL